MAYERRQFAGAAAATTLSVSITNVSASLTLISSTGWPDGSTGAFTVVVDRGLATEEKVKCSARAGLVLTVAGSGRGYDGTSAQAHAAGATVEHTLSAIDLDEANQAVVATLGKVTAAGDLLVATGSGVIARQGVGSTGQILQVDTAQTNKIKWAALPAGSVATASFAAGAVDATALGTGAVTSAKILDGTIVAADIASGTITDTQVAAANKDGVAGTASLRTLGTGAQQAAAGNDSRFGSAAPTGAAGGDLAGTYPNPTIGTGKVTSTHILDGTIVAGDLAAGAITNATLPAGYRLPFAGTSAPASPSQGDHWYDTTNKVLNIYSGAVWMTITHVAAVVAGSLAVSQTSYGAISGPAVSILTGTKALVTVEARLINSASTPSTGSVSFAVSGATTVAAADGFALQTSGDASGVVTHSGAATFLVTGLTAGTNTFTMQGKVSAGSYAMSDRHISVVAIPT